MVKKSAYIPQFWPYTPKPKLLAESLRTNIGRALKYWTYL